MSDNVYWMLELAIRPGELENFKKLMDEMIASTEENEPDTLNYEWTISEDGATCHLFERYKDSSAVMAHLGTFGSKFARRFLEFARPTRIVVHGRPSPQVKKALGPMGPIYMTPLGGFSRS